MKKSLMAKSFALVFAVALFAGLAPAAAANVSVVQIDLVLPAASVSFDEGLDVRDAQGKPSASPLAKRQLRQLFVSSLFALLMRPDLPRVAAMLALLEKTWKVASGTWDRAAKFVWTLAVEVWSPPFKKLKLAPLWAALAVLAALIVQFSGFSSTQPRTDSHLKFLSCTILRC